MFARQYHEHTHMDPTLRRKLRVSFRFFGCMLGFEDQTWHKHGANARVRAAQPTHVPENQWKLGLHKLPDIRVRVRMQQSFGHGHRFHPVFSHPRLKCLLAR
jgi:hypothetical protein